jgi:hypothetical protein
MQRSISGRYLHPTCIVGLYRYVYILVFSLVVQICSFILESQGRHWESLESICRICYYKLHVPCTFFCSVIPLLSHASRIAPFLIYFYFCNLYFIKNKNKELERCVQVKYVCFWVGLHKNVLSLLSAGSSFKIFRFMHHILKPWTFMVTFGLLSFFSVFV